MPQLEDARSIKAPGRSIAGSASFLRIPRSHIARPTNTPTGIGGESSVSDAAEHRQEMAPCSKTPNTVSSNGSRPSLLPRPTGSFSSRPQRPPSSTVSPSTAGPSMPPSAVQTTSAPPSTSKFGISKDHTRNVLRRKAPTIGRQQVQRNETLSGPSGVGPAPSSAQPNLRVDTGPKTPQPQSRPQLEEVASMLPLRLPEAKAKGESSTHRIPKELAGLLDTNNLPPPTPNFASASSPSTRYSESPGVWSRESTPTSLSSYSPGIVYPTRVGHHLRQQSPIYVRPPMPSKPVAASPQAEKIETKGLKSQSPDRIAAPSLPSSLTGKVGQGETAGIKSPAKSPGPPRSPPPRKSSTQFKSPELKQGDDENKQREEERKVEEAEKAIFDYRSHGETTATPPAPSVTPPLRPSRDGTDKLELKPSPVVQSNLAVLRTTGHKRRESAENVPSAARPRPHPVGTAAASADSLHSRIPSRTTTPSGIPTRSMKTSTEPKEKKEITKKTSTRRFGIFTKRSKTELDGSNYSRADKPTRKGPAAGTGHEGYGKYGHRGRKSSVSSNSSVRGRSTSTTRSASKSVSSTKSSGNSRLEQDIDDFLLNRLEPVVITGGGMDGASHIRTHSEQSVSNVSSVSSVSLTSTSNLTGYTKTPYHGYSTESLASSAGAFGQSTESVVSERDHHMAMQVESQRRNPVLVNRNSIYGSQNLSMKDATKSTGSVNTASAKSLSSGHGYSSSLTALPQTRSAVSASKNERATQDRNTIKKLPKQGKSSKWNFFQRSRATDRKEPPPAPAATPATELHATISVVPTSRQVAHYALLDNDTDSLEDILHQIEESPPTEGEEMASPADIPAGLNIKKRRCQSILLPPTPKLQAEFNKGGPSSPKVFFSKEPPTIQQEKNQAPRPSRLMPVGRIPQVISRRDREHKPAQQSFSRPFCRDEAPSLAVTANCQPGQQYTFSRPPLGIQTDVIPSGPFRPEHDTAKPFSAPASGDGLNFLTGPYSNNEFLRFSPVKGSELSGSSSSEGKLSLEAVTAVNLEQGPLPTEDEVWDEYDDLIDSISPETSKAPNPGESNTGERFQLATMASKTLQAELNAHNDSTTLPSPTESSSRTIVPASARSSVSSVRLRRSRIVSALHSSITPSAQPSYSELIANYGDEGKKGADSAHLDVPSTSTRAGDQIVVPRSPSPLASTNFEASRHRNTILFDIAERDREGTTAQTNLRSGSLMASRWLSFGRVLFSPAHNHVNSRDQERILVIDGLGNDDWSFYCALTYPNATVYNLNIGSSPSASTHPDGWQPPDNYHVTYHPSIEDPFPFQKSFFAVCILRFPAACSEVAQSNIISECKRVLRPGGYLEMSILDLDLVSMGNWTRRAVRMLKERIYLADPNISLRSASDSIQRLLGRCGFDNLNRCMVRVPVAGIIVESSDSSSSNPSSSAAAATTTAGYSPEMSRKEQRTQHRSASDDGNMSLGDLLSGSPSSSNDESIAKIVTKVGRWWYTRCYEIPVLPDGDLDRSIWADKKLLRECQKRGTGFRLLIAYAQKPSEKRRTASV
ncbi:hypothetical protein VTN00DRAFT_6733 [Thermoascus crustaceus]|uniref:uncharacterized protein n=1 Tax=Thermoascus crustaceus TaxID=5088 RepID=UPI0037448B96